MNIDPTLKEHRGKVLWCVYGPECFPSIICCKVHDCSTGPTIWGYSIYHNVSGFRTLGININTWIKEHKNPRELCKFYDSQEEAFDLLREITSPMLKEI